MTEIFLHEDLYATSAGAILVAHATGHFDLQIKAQLLCRAPSREMQMRTYRPEKISGSGKGIELLWSEQAEGHQIGDILDLINIFCDPVERLQIAQPAFALFDVGLDHIALALFQMTLVAFCQFGLDEILGIAREQLGAQPVCKRVGELLVAGQKSLLQHRRADGVILRAQPDAILDGAAGVPHLEPEIP